MVLVVVDRIIFRSFCFFVMAMVVVIVKFDGGCFRVAGGS